MEHILNREKPKQDKSVICPNETEILSVNKTFFSSTIYSYLLWKYIQNITCNEKD